jgi:hypothetical protein
MAIIEGVPAALHPELLEQEALHVYFVGPACAGKSFTASMLGSLSVETVDPEMLLGFNTINPIRMRWVLKWHNYNGDPDLKAMTDYHARARELGQAYEILEPLNRLKNSVALLDALYHPDDVEYAQEHGWYGIGFDASESVRRDRYANDWNDEKHYGPFERFFARLLEKGFDTYTEDAVRAEDIESVRKRVRQQFWEADVLDNISHRRQVAQCMERVDTVIDANGDEREVLAQVINKIRGFVCQEYERRHQT